jgi:hypothetical protein
MNIDTRVEVMKVNEKEPKWAVQRHSSHRIEQEKKRQSGVDRTTYITAFLFLFFGFPPPSAPSC